MKNQPTCRAKQTDLFSTCNYTSADSPIQRFWPKIPQFGYNKWPDSYLKPHPLKIYLTHEKCGYQWHISVNSLLFFLNWFKKNASSEPSHPLATSPHCSRGAVQLLPPPSQLRCCWRPRRRMAGDPSESIAQASDSPRSSAWTMGFRTPAFAMETIEYYVDRLRASPIYATETARHQLFWLSTNAGWLAGLSLLSLRKRELIEPIFKV